MTPEFADALAIFSISVAAISLLVTLWCLKAVRASSKDMFEGFLVRFPGRCPICSYHRFGLTHGFNVPNQPDPHENCPEKNPGSSEPASE